MDEMKEIENPEMPKILDNTENSGKPRKKWWKICLIVLTALVVAAVSVYWGLDWLWVSSPAELDLTIHGGPEITVEYGESFEAPGATAKFTGAGLCKGTAEVPVSAHGTVNTDKLGVYTLTYTAEYRVDFLFWYKILSAERELSVVVMDTKAPVITLVSSPDTYTLPGQVYQEEGFTAVDNREGDITNRVERIETPETVTYRVSDNCGNTAEMVREIVYNDPIAPTLTLKGKEKISLYVGSNFKEPGYTAEDNCDGDITGRVEVTGKVNTEKTGKYTLEYSVSDSYGNTVKRTRTVVVEKRPEPKPPVTPKPPVDNNTPENPENPGTPEPPENPKGGVIYLTFDDGPSKHTSRLLDILAKYDVKATFFVTNNGNINIISRAAAEGHTVAIHAKSHKYKEIYASEEAYFDDLYAMRDIIAEKTGKTPNLIRFPGGSSNTVSRFNKGIMSRLTKLVQEKGFKYFDWNVDSNDAGGAKTSDEVFYNVTHGVAKRKNSVVLQHDTKGFSVDAVERIIVWGLEHGYTFKALTSDSPGCHHRVNN